DQRIGTHRPRPLSSRIVIGNDLFDAKASMCNRKDAIFQTVHRAERARFHPRRNERDIAAAFDQMSELFIVVMLVGQPFWITTRGNRQSGLISWIAFAENYQAHVICEKSIQHRHQNIEPFGFNCSGHHAEDGPARRGRELEASEQGIARRGLSFQLLHAVTRWKKLIVFRIPPPVISAAQNAAQAKSIFTEYAVE